MESSVTVPRVGVAAEDLPEAAALFDAKGPFLSVVLDTELAVENAPLRFEKRWKDHRRALHDRGAPDALLDRVGRWLHDARTEGNAIACIAAADGPMVTAIDDSIDQDIARWDSLPHLTTLIEWHQSNPPALLVLVDRTGADIFAGGPAQGLVEVVEGDDGPEIRKSAPGGWSQHRYQQRAEERWRSNTGEVAETLLGLIDRMDPRIVVMAGDVRAVELVEEQLPSRVHQRIRRVTGGRGKGSDGSIDEGTARLYRSAVAEDTVDLLAKLKEELGQRDRATTGIADTAAALRIAAVDTLLIYDDPRSRRRMFFRESDRTSIALAEEELEGLDLKDGPVPDVLIRAAWGSGARVRIVPKVPELTDGAAAILRFVAP